MKSEPVLKAQAHVRDQFPIKLSFSVTIIKAKGQTLQTEDYDLPYAMELLKNRKDFFKDLRLDTALNEMLCDAREFPDEIDIPAKFELTQPRHRVQRRNVNFDYMRHEKIR
ncbi:uncharacterized protein TNCV_3428641 [Trichonephila clavipes]|nr:uncharacterized protein TNCV_3428641 [Trichonephila clavipes]